MTSTFITLIGSRLSFYLNGQLVELEAYPGRKLRASYGRDGERRTLCVSSFSDSTRGHEPVHYWTFDGRGWIQTGESYTDEPLELPTIKRKGARPSNSDDESGGIWLDGKYYPPGKPTSSATKESASRSSGGHGQQHAGKPESMHPRTTYVAPGRPSS
jgi:hypothetical protein